MSTTATVAGTEGRGETRDRLGPSEGYGESANRSETKFVF